MALTDADLAWIRDEVGTQTPPTDTDLDDTYIELGNRTLVAIRVLKRRRAAIAGGSTVDSVSIAGVFSISQRSNIKALDEQIARLEALYLADTGEAVDDGSTAGVTFGRLTRTDRSR